MSLQGGENHDHKIAVTFDIYGKGQLALTKVNNSELHLNKQG